MLKRSILSKHSFLIPDHKRKAITVFNKVLSDALVDILYQNEESPFYSKNLQRVSTINRYLYLVSDFI